MLLPTRRWLLGAALLALPLPLATWWPGIVPTLVILDLGWVLALAWDAQRVARRLGPGIEVRREAPPAFTVGRAQPVALVWSNPHAVRVVVRVVADDPEPVASPQAGPREVSVPGSGTLRERFEVEPRIRGEAAGGALHLRIRTPLGLAWHQRTVALPWSVLVYPAAGNAPSHALTSAAQRRREAGRVAARHLGEGRLFESLREWVPGEDLRGVDWKATARRGKLIVRQYEDERRQQVVIMVDVGRLLTAESAGVPRLDSAIRAAVQLARSAVARDDNVGLLLFADQILQFIPPARGRRALRGILDGLARVQGRMVESDYPGAFLYLAARLRRRVFTVLFTDVIDATASEAVVTHSATLRPRHLPLVVLLRDPSTDVLATARPASVRMAFERAAAEELLAERAEAIGVMRAHGVLVLDVPAETAAEATVAQYQQLKRRGAI
jgi:uncharacterized protein (DUF58 family)